MRVRSSAPLSLVDYTRATIKLIGLWRVPRHSALLSFPLGLIPAPLHVYSPVFWDGEVIVHLVSFHSLTPPMRTSGDGCTIDNGYELVLISSLATGDSPVTLHVDGRYDAVRF